MDSGIVAWIECVTVTIMWKVVNSRGTVLLQLQKNDLQWTLCGKYFTASGKWYCSL